MTKSMTGFAAIEEQINILNISIDIRSVNSRFLEVSLRLPEVWRLHEDKIRRLIQKYIKRGRVELRCSLKGHREAEGFVLNQALLGFFMKTYDQLKSAYPVIAPPTISDLLSWPHMLLHPDHDEDQITQVDLMCLVERLLVEHGISCATEGRALLQSLLDKLVQIKSCIEVIQHFMPTLLEEYRERMREKVEALSLDIPIEKINQEIVFYSMRSDVQEEIDRLNAHVNAFEELLLSAPDTIGKRLDFLIQEMNREANTIGSKTSSLLVSEQVILLKVLIEQMREQVQNLQ